MGKTLANMLQKGEKESSQAQTTMSLVFLAQTLLPRSHAKKETFLPGKRTLLKAKNSVAEKS